MRVLRASYNWLHYIDDERVIRCVLFGSMSHQIICGYILYNPVDNATMHLRVAYCATAREASLSFLSHIFSWCIAQQECVVPSRRTRQSIMYSSFTRLDRQVCRIWKRILLRCLPRNHPAPPSILAVLLRGFATFRCLDISILSQRQARLQRRSDINMRRMFHSDWFVDWNLASPCREGIGV